MLDAGFFNTMYNMIAVATDKPYLSNVSNDDEDDDLCKEKKGGGRKNNPTYHVKMY
jgi:hypothetical protein